MKKILFSLFALILATGGAAATEWTWIGPASGSMQGATNYGKWKNALGNNPTSNIASTDTLVFGDVGGSPVNINASLLLEGWTFNSSHDYRFTTSNSAYILGFAGNASSLPQFSQLGTGKVDLANTNFRLAGQRVFYGANGSGEVVFTNLMNATNNTAGGVTMEGAIRIVVNGVQQTATANSSANTWRFNSSAATLGGAGTLATLLENSLTAKRGADGATIAPGATGAAGTLTLKGGLKLERTTNLRFDLGGVAGAHDKISILGGDYTGDGISDSTFTLRAPADGGKFVIHLNDLGLVDFSIFSGTPITLIESATDGSVTFDFSTVTGGDFIFGDMPTGWLGDSSFGTNGILFNMLTGNLSIQLIPEPGSVAMLFLGGIGMLAVLRRNRAKR